MLNKTYLKSPEKSGKNPNKLVEILITEKVWKKSVQISKNIDYEKSP